MDVVYAIKKECYRRRLSHRTTVAYVYWVKRFFMFCKKDHKEITKKDVKEFIHLLSDRNLCANTLNVALNSIKFMLDFVLYKKWRLNIKYSKKPKKLPVVLTKEEIIWLINVIKNPKHKLIVELMYSAGLRVGELTNLKVRDLEIENCCGWVRSGKGNKDRIFIIAEKLKNKLVYYIKKECLDYGSFFFKGQNGKFSVRSVQNIVKKAAKNAGIKKNVHPHTLRHSFATHIIENGYSRYSLQELLGHNSPETTTMYIHTAIPGIKIKSPYDTI
ncbi:MAG: site-specific tyrosine recombinase/integron integrase [Nanoarchaeota archaeon]